MSADTTSLVRSSDEVAESGMLSGRTQLEKILAGVVALLSIALLALIIAVGVLGGRGGGGGDGGGVFSLPARPNDGGQIADIRRRLFAGVDKRKIQSNLRRITQNVHVAGTKHQLDLLQWLHDNYASTGMDSVEFFDYNVSLSYPDYSKPNTIYLESSSGGSSKLISTGLADFEGPDAAQREEKLDPKSRNLWLAYAASGTVTGPIVYVNYGRIQDFDDVEKVMSVSGYICLIRYGMLFRGKKVEEGAKRGCKGVILYSDYAEVGPSKGQNGTWPNGPWLPPSNGQRGSTMVFDGDLLTPSLPSKDYVYRTQNFTQAYARHFISDIPATPIGYADATKIFAELDGPVSSLPSGFKGGNPNTIYRLTGSAHFTLNVYGNLTTRSPIRNVVGKIYGSEEPDRWIILTNHVDAWTFGSQDPNGATAIITEVARAFMAAYNATGWRPRRSLLFVSVDSEEFGLIGSTEWVEEMIKTLQIRAVALLNVDVALHGTTAFDAATVPLLYRAIVAAAKLVPNPNKAEVALNRHSVYDSWLFWKNPANTTQPFLPTQSSVPFMAIPSSGSDQSGFQNYAGIPTSYFSFRCFPRSCYPLYHTMLELDWTVENVVDPGFNFSKAIGDVWTELARNLADSLIIPFNVSDYAAILQQYTQHIQTQLKTQKLDSKIPHFDQVMGNLRGAADRMAAAAGPFQALVEAGNSGTRSFSLGQVQMINDRLAGLERCFLTPQGLPGRFNFRHVVFATSINNNYEGVSFAGIADAASDYLQASTDQGRSEALHNLRLCISQVQFAIESAIHFLDLSGMPE